MDCEIEKNKINNFINLNNLENINFEIENATLETAITGLRKGTKVS